MTRGLAELKNHGHVVDPGAGIVIPRALRKRGGNQLGQRPRFDGL